VTGVTRGVHSKHGSGLWVGVDVGEYDKEPGEVHLDEVKELAHLYSMTNDHERSAYE
jgi:hypothetical protein